MRDQLRLQVGIDDPVTPKVDLLVDIPESIVRTSLWPKAVGEIREACLEYRFDYDFDSRLNNAVCHRGDGGFIMHFLQ